MTIDNTITSVTFHQFNTAVFASILREAAREIGVGKDVDVYVREVLRDLETQHQNTK